MADQEEAHVSKHTIPPELGTFLKEYPELRFDEKKGKVCCCLTGHEMPPKEDAVRSFVTGKKFLHAQQQREFDFAQYRPHLVPNTKKKFEHTLFCMLTLRNITKRPADVERHVDGKRYQRALKRWQRCQETGEKFKPRAGRKKADHFTKQKDERTSEQGNNREFWESDSEDEHDQDDLGDLYPSDDFASADEIESDNDEAKEVANGKVTDKPGSDSSDEEIENDPSGRVSHKTLKRKKVHKSVGKKKARM